MNKPESYSPEFPDAAISDDSKDSFQLTKLSRKSSKRSYRRQQLSVGDSTEIHIRKGKRSDEGRHKESRHTDRQEERQRRSEDRYRGERARESYERDLMRESSSSKRRDERHRSPTHHRYERIVVYKSREHSRDKERSISSRSTDRKQSKRDIPITKERPSSDSETDGEIKPPLTKRPSVISPLSSSDDSEKDSNSSRTSKELNNSSRSPERIDDKTDNSLKEQVKSWKDIADESSESDNDSSQHNNQDDEEFSQLSLKYSGMQSISSSEIDEAEREQPKGSPPLVDPDLNEEPAIQQQKPQDVEVMEEEEEMIVEKEDERAIYLPALMGCRSVESYEWLNRIEEGTYGVVFRGKEKRTGDVVALKKLKMEKEREGFPITSLREINMLLKSSHPNIVHVREIVVGSNMDKIYIVMDYVEHDLKSLMEVMKQPFLEGEVKTLMIQLLRAVHHMHDNWILHRDLKTSNLLLSHKGILKVADFGLAREYGSPLKRYTPIVVTLWYRCPELLLGAKEYSTAVDVWSVGCIFAELLQHKPVFTGKSEIDQLNYIFKELGTPNDDIWPGYNELPVAKKVDFAKQPLNNLRKRFPLITNSGFNLLNKFLTYDPKRRITAEEGLKHPHFEESPLPVDPSMFPTWPAKSEMVKKPNRQRSPTAPEGGAFLLNTGKDEEDGKFQLTTAQTGKAALAAGPGFTLKF